MTIEGKVEEKKLTDKDKEIKEKQERKAALANIQDIVIKQILMELGLEKKHFTRITIVPVWENRFRVNMWQEYENSMRIKYSYFIVFNEEDGSITSSPKIQREEKENV